LQVTDTAGLDDGIDVQGEDQNVFKVGHGFLCGQTLLEKACWGLERIRTAQKTVEREASLSPTAPFLPSNLHAAPTRGLEFWVWGLGFWIWSGTVTPARAVSCPNPESSSAPAPDISSCGAMRAGGASHSSERDRAMAGAPPHGGAPAHHPRHQGHCHLAPDIWG
jgi:hypothetical protein